MNLVASLVLQRRPWNIVRLPGGELLLHTSSSDGAFLEAHAPDLTPTWSAHLDGQPIQLLLAEDGTPWVLDPSGVSAFSAGGARQGRVEPQVPTGMQVSTVGCADDDLIFAYQHVPNAMRAPIVARVTAGGRVRWWTMLPVGPVAYEGVVQMSADEGWKPRPVNPWMPQTWLSSVRSSKRLDVSGDAVLACFSDSASSGIGLGYVLALANGALRFTTKMGPISETAALGGGAFLVGYQGYGAFETLRYECDGSVHQRWPSHGHYLITGTDVRVIEMENVLPSQMHLTRLLPGGAVVRGAWLDGYYTSTPGVRADGTALFFRNGALLAARDLAIDDRLELCAPDDKALSTPVVIGDDSAYFAFQRKVALGELPRLARVAGRDM